MPGDARVFEDDFNPINYKLESGEADADASISLPMNEKEYSTRENNVAKIRVVVCQNFIYICITSSFMHRFLVFHVLLWGLNMHWEYIFKL